MLPLAERLRSGRQFQQVFAEGQSFADGGPGLVVLHVLKRTEGAERQCGFTVGKKVGNAVVRNLVKRRLREAYRATLNTLPRGYWCVVVARSKAASADHAALSQALAKALVRAGLTPSVSSQIGVGGGLPPAEP
jgi:ribonuclease P protein component